MPRPLTHPLFADADLEPFHRFPGKRFSENDDPRECQPQVDGLPRDLHDAEHLEAIAAQKHCFFRPADYLSCRADYGMELPQENDVMNNDCARGRVGRRSWAHRMGGGRSIRRSPPPQLSPPPSLMQYAAEEQAPLRPTAHLHSRCVRTMRSPSPPPPPTSTRRRTGWGFSLEEVLRLSPSMQLKAVSALQSIRPRGPALP